MEENDWKDKTREYFRILQLVASISFAHSISIIRVLQSESWRIFWYPQKTQNLKCLTIDSIIFFIVSREQSVVTRDIFFYFNKHRKTLKKFIETHSCRYVLWQCLTTVQTSKTRKKQIPKNDWPDFKSNTKYSIRKNPRKKRKCLLLKNILLR